SLLLGPVCVDGQVLAPFRPSIVPCANLPDMADFETDSGIEIERCYTRTEGYDAQIGQPGEFPFTRGIQQTMYRGKLWTMRQYAGFGSASETNNRFKY